ncbi:MAG: helix-turn-helix transcriptional regulator [Peptostreptococcaceae bacterium]
MKKNSFLADFLIKHRNDLELSQELYAKAIGVSRQTLSHLELGMSPSGRTLKILCKYFNKGADELLGQDKVNQLASLETTNMLIDSYIKNGIIKDPDDLDTLTSFIIDSLKLEIKLKLELMKS